MYVCCICTVEILDNGMRLLIPSQQRIRWHPTGNLKSAIVGVLTPRESAAALNQDVFPRVPGIKHFQHTTRCGYHGLQRRIQTKGK